MKHSPEIFETHKYKCNNARNRCI